MAVYIKYNTSYNTSNILYTAVTAVIITLQSSLRQDGSFLTLTLFISRNYILNYKFLYQLVKQLVIKFTISCPPSASLSRNTKITHKNH